jgi:PKD repeat protein
MTTAGFTVSSITAGIAGSEGGGSRMVLYEQDYTDNRIVLGGNDGLTTGAQSNYVLIIKSLTSGIGSLEANQLPVAVADSDVAAVTLGTAVNFDATGSSDPEDGTVGIWSWDFGDGTGTSAAESPAYTYTEIGTYCAVLTVTDGSGGSSSDSVTITVNEVPANEVQITGVGPSSFSAERLFRGSQLYTDRSYTIISMPDLIEGKKGIRTVNDYKTSTSSGLLAFTVDEDVTLYVLYDQDRTTLPSWLSGFTDVGDVVTSAATMDVLESPSTYSAGQILLGGNHSGSGDGLQNYVVLVDGASDDSCGTSVSENGWYYADDTDGDGLPDWFETGKSLDTYAVDTNGDTIMDEDEDNGSSSTYFAEWQVIKNTKEEKKDAGGGGGCVPGPVSGLPLAGLLAAAVFGLAIIRLRRK